MVNNPRRVFWLITQSVDNLDVREWEARRSQGINLINHIGRPEFIHDVVTPLGALSALIDQLKGDSFSSIIDLTGKSSVLLKRIFPNNAIEGGLSLRRVRNVSSPILETVGYLASMNRREITLS